MYVRMHIHTFTHTGYVHTYLHTHGCKCMWCAYTHVVCLTARCNNFCVYVFVRVSNFLFMVRITPFPQHCSVYLMLQNLTM